MMKKAMKTATLIVAAALVSAPLAFAPAAARSPAYQQARSAGLIGEQVDGYLGIVGSADAATRALVQDINNQRRQAYTQKAQQNGVTISDWAFTSGCSLISKTVPGEKYEAPDGSWQTRTSSPPIRHPNCP